MPARFQKQLNRASALKPRALRESKQMAVRLKGGDEAAFMQLAMGGRVAKGALHDAKPDAFFAAWAQRRRQLTLPPSEIIEPALVFVRTSFFGLLRKRGDYVFVRPGIDAWPDPRQYRLQARVPQLSHAQWAELLGRGIMPLSFGRMRAHDLAHFSELFIDAELMAATRKYYAGYATWSKERIGAVSKLWSGSNSVEARHASRMSFAMEAFSLPNLRQVGLARRLMGRPPNGLDEAKARLAKLSDAEVLDRANAIYAERDKLLLRMGGSQRDPYNVERVVKHELFRHPKEMVAPSNMSSFVELHRGSLAGLLEETQIAGAPLRDSLARFEYGWWQGYAMRLTKADVMRDLHVFEGNAEGKVARFVTSFGRASTLLYRAYAKHEDQAPSP